MKLFDLGQHIDDFFRDPSAKNLFSASALVLTKGRTEIEDRGVRSTAADTNISRHLCYETIATAAESFDKAGALR